MKVFKIISSRWRPEEGETQLDAFGGLISAYRMDGHVLGRELMTVSLEDSIEAYVFIAARDAFASKNKNEWIRKSLSKMKTAGLAAPKFVVVGDDLSESDACRCKNSSSFILFTTYIQVQSPVRCGDCLKPVPLYRLPRFKSGEFHEVISWADDWKACDSLFMNSGTGERFGYREMSQVDSSLSRQGRSICAHFQQTTGKPTYYYLHRYYGHSKSVEEARLCPGCGGNWRLDKKRFRFFDFKCEKCRLASCVSSAV